MKTIVADVKIVPDGDGGAVIVLPGNYRPLCVKKDHNVRLTWDLRGIPEAEDLHPNGLMVSPRSGPIIIVSVTRDHFELWRGPTDDQSCVVNPCDTLIATMTLQGVPDDAQPGITFKFI